MKYSDARKYAIEMAKKDLCARIIKNLAENSDFETIDAYATIPCGYESYELIHKLYCPVPAKAKYAKKTA